MTQTGGGIPAFKDHFSAHSAEYAARRPAYPSALADWLARVVPDTALALECGCGSGQLSLLLGGRFGRVVATDASPQQIANAPPHPSVEYRCVPAEASGLPDACTDLVVVAQAVHWFDLPAFYAEVRRVARPGAMIALISYAAPVIEPAINAALRRFHHETMRAYWPPERDLVEAGYRTLPFPFAEIAAPDLEMAVDWAAEDLIGYLDTWSAVRAYERAHGTSPIPAFREALLRAWPAGVRHTVRWPLAIRAGRVDA